MIRTTRFFDSGRLLAMAAALLALTMITFSPARAVEIPSDDDQDVLIRTTLMTFNDANMTGNYSVFFSKASKEWQAQISIDKMQSAFEGFRKNQLFFEDVVTADYDSSEKASIDKDGALLLAGVFKTDDMEVKYHLRFVQNGNVWKVLGIQVDATRKKPN